ncbi:hypothetical protein [Neobacillus vireti]|uniref:hypothetical protein n=1 Tax=Neobacillus vireti TaxID=220686 RepID=UPI002FFEBBB4
MDLNTFIRLYQAFLKECGQKGWMIEILIEEFGNYLAAITNMDGIEVQFYIELDLENSVQLNGAVNQSRLDYGVIRDVGEADLFAKEVLEEFHQYWVNHIPKRYSSFILYKQ